MSAPRGGGSTSIERLTLRAHDLSDTQARRLAQLVAAALARTPCAAGVVRIEHVSADVGAPAAEDLAGVAQQTALAVAAAVRRAGGGP